MRVVMAFTEGVLRKTAMVYSLNDPIDPLFLKSGKIPVECRFIHVISEGTFDLQIGQCMFGTQKMV